MKKIGIAIISLLSILALSSCATKHNGPFLSASPGNPTISAPKSGASYVLDKSKAADTLFTMKWSAPNYGYPAAVSYTIQMDKQGDNFKNPIKVGTSNLPSFSITQGGLNGVLMGNGFTPGTAYTLNFRVMASISDSLSSQVSNTISMVVTPYSNYVYIYVPGGYQANSGYGSGWNPPTAPPLAMVSTDVYSGYVYMVAASGSDGQFKFTKDQNWNTNWGMGSTAGTLALNSSTNITIPSTGYYLVNVNLNTLTYTLTKTAWSVIGDATPGGWSTDTPLTYDPTKMVWTTTMALTKGSIKFRANDSWNINFGDGGNGNLVEGGNTNITVPSAGTYKITLNLSNPPLYKYSLVKQ